MAPKAIIAAAMHKLAHLIYGVLKTRQPFDAGWAKKAVQVVEITVAIAIAIPVKINALVGDFQDGI